MFWLRQVAALCVCVCICSVLSSRGAAARRMATKRPPAGTMPAAATATAADGKSKDNGHNNWATIETKPQSQSQSQWQPQPQPQPQSQPQSRPQSQSQPRVIESFDHRFLDGHYEYRYVLSNGDTRHEHAYWLSVGKTKVLARKGFYSAPMSNNKFLTVFYKADQNGYHEDSYTLSAVQPTLPRSLDVPVTAIVRPDADADADADADVDGDMATSMAAAADIGKTAVHVKRNSMTAMQAAMLARMLEEAMEEEEEEAKEAGVAKGTTTKPIQFELRGHRNDDVVDVVRNDNHSNEDNNNNNSNDTWHKQELEQTAQGK